MYVCAWKRRCLRGGAPASTFCVLSFAVITSNYNFLKSCVAFLGPPEVIKAAGLQGSFFFKDFLQTSVSASLFSRCAFLFPPSFVLVCLPAIYWVTRLFLYFFFSLDPVCAAIKIQNTIARGYEDCHFSASLLYTTCCRPIFFFLPVFCRVHGQCVVSRDAIWFAGEALVLWCAKMLFCLPQGRVANWLEHFFLFPYSWKWINLVNSAMQIKTVKIFTKHTLVFRIHMHPSFD